MKQKPVTALLLVGMIAFAGPALAGSDNPQSFSALKDVRAERLSEREMASITGQGFSSVGSTLNTIASALATVARRQ